MPSKRTSRRSTAPAVDRCLQEKVSFPADGNGAAFFWDQVRKLSCMYGRINMDLKDCNGSDAMALRCRPGALRTNGDGDRKLY